MLFDSTKSHPPFPCRSVTPKRRVTTMVKF
jgi:hypothetical protein